MFSFHSLRRWSLTTEWWKADAITTSPGGSLFDSWITKPDSVLLIVYLPPPPPMLFTAVIEKDQHGLIMLTRSKTTWQHLPLNIIFLTDIFMGFVVPTMALWRNWHPRCTLRNDKILNFLLSFSPICLKSFYSQWKNWSLNKNLVIMPAILFHFEFLFRCL